MPEYLVELYSVADPDSAALARLGDGSGRSLPALDPDPGRRDLSAPGRSRLRRAGRGGVRAGRSAGGSDRGGRRPASARGDRQPKEEDMTKLRFVGLIAVLVVGRKHRSGLGPDADPEWARRQGSGRPRAHVHEMDRTRLPEPGRRRRRRHRRQVRRGGLRAHSERQHSFTSMPSTS